MHFIIYLILFNRLFYQRCGLKNTLSVLLNVSEDCLKEYREFLGTNFLEEKLHFAFSRHE